MTAKPQQEGRNRYCAQTDKNYIDGAMQPLTRPAMRALHQMLFVITAHLGSNPGDVIPPAGKYVAYHSISACCRLHCYS